MIINAGLVLQGAICSLSFRPLPSGKLSNTDQLPPEQSVKMQSTLDNGTSENARKKNVCSRIKEISIIKHGQTLFGNRLFMLYLLGNLFMPFGFFAMFQHTQGGGELCLKAMKRMEAAIAVSAIGICYLFGRLATTLFLRLQCTNRVLFTFAVVLGSGVIILVSCFPSSFYPYAITTALYGCTVLTVGRVCMSLIGLCKFIGVLWGEKNVRVPLCSYV